jgi:predicted MFS family arabinose efflux permease
MLAGTVLGGVLAEMLGARTTMFIGAISALPAALWLFWSPVRRLRRI